MRRFIPARSQFDDVIAVAAGIPAEMRAVCEEASIKMLEGVPDLGESLNSALAGVNFSDWCVLIKPGFEFDATLLGRLREVVLNPGSLYSLAGDAVSGIVGADKRVASLPDVQCTGASPRVHICPGHSLLAVT